MHSTATATRYGWTRPIHGRLARRFAAAAKRLFEALRRSRRRRAIAALSDHMRRDIGLPPDLHVL